MQDLLDDFLEALEQSGSPVKNPVLRLRLRWDEATYEAVKAELVGRRIVVRGRGRSDSVSLVGAEPVEQPAQAANGSNPSGNGRGRPAGRNAKGTAAEPKDKSLESWIWDAACSIRGAKDAAKYKDYLLPLIFTKRLCDVFDDELNRIAEQVGSRGKAFPYLRHLALKLPKRSLGKSYQFDDEIDLNDYRLQKISEGSISLTEGQANPLDGPHEVGSGVSRPEQLPLSRLIDLINERFGGELNDADQLFFDQIAEPACSNAELAQAAKVNPLDKFQLVFAQTLESLLIERMELNEELFADFMGKADMRALITSVLGNLFYKQIVDRQIE